MPEQDTERTTSTPSAEAFASSPPPRSRTSIIALALLPLVLLGALIAVFYVADMDRMLTSAFPPIEELEIERFELEKGHITAHVINGGPDPVTIAQVLVDDAYWSHEVEPARTIPRLGRAEVHIPYMWVEGEAHTVKLITETGVTFEEEIGVAVASPVMSMRMFAFFAMLGVYVGVIPVAVGLLWFPALKRTPQKWIDFILFLTMGLLLFLGIDAVAESLEIANELPGALQGVGILALGIIGTIGVLTILQRLIVGDREATGHRAALALAYMVAVGIGLHNLGEGLAIGAAYALGNITLGSMLVLGFTLHNTTEGLAIVAPVARTGARLWHLVVMGAIGGVPTILGTWMGGFAYSRPWALLFLAIGAGAIFQVLWQITAQVAERRGGVARVVDGLTVTGLLIGMGIMYGTGLLVAA